jgi:drug/metabolite transporter (DMT)-like permease
VAGSLLAYTAYVWLLAHAPVSQAATYTYVNPIVAVLLGWLVLDERITLTTVAGAALIIGSVAMVVRRESTRAPPEPRRPTTSNREPSMRR